MRIDHTLFWLMLSVWASSALGLQPTPVRKVDAECASCHQKIFRTCVTTPMANASGIATDNLKPGTLMHSRSAVEYGIAGTSEQGQITYRSLNARHFQGCMAGDGEAARHTITQSLTYCPDCDDLQQLFTQFGKCVATGRN